MTKLDQLLQEIRNEIGADLLYIDIVGTDGLSISDLNLTSTADTSSISARWGLAAKLTIKVADKLNLGEVEDDLITIDSRYAMMHMLGDGSYFVVLGFKKEAPLGVVRMILRDYSEQLWDAVPR